MSLLHTFGLTIAYQDTLDLEAAWAAEDIEKNVICPEELDNGVPGTCIMDNDDFKEDTLTGNCSI